MLVKFLNINAKKSALSCLILICLAWSIVGIATPKKNLWPRWEVNDPLSKKTIDHSSWQYFTKKYITTTDEGLNLVNYSTVTENDKQILKDYLLNMSQIDIDKYNRDVQLAFWLNLYNAITLNLVLEHYPIESIKDINISPGLFAIGPWDANVIKINKTSITLNDIEHRIIRPIWNDPRIHYGLNCASIGCPNLRKQAFTGENIDEQLNDAAKTYINSLRGVQVIDGKIVASKLYEWYQSDFGGGVDNVIKHFKLYANKKLKQQLGDLNTISDYIYNWHLNETQH